MNKKKCNLAQCISWRTGCNIHRRGNLTRHCVTIALVKYYSIRKHMLLRAEGAWLGNKIILKFLFFSWEQGGVAVKYTEFQSFYVSLVSLLLSSLFSFFFYYYFTCFKAKLTIFFINVIFMNFILKIVSSFSLGFYFRLLVYCCWPSIRSWSGL